MGVQLNTGGFAGLQQSIAGAVGSVSAPGALNVSLQANPANTTTAVNITVVVKGVPQGMVQSLSIDEEFNFARVKALGSAVNIAFLPGVYEATGQINKAFLYGVTMENAFGGGLRAVVGKYLANVDFTQFYFNINEVDNLGNTLAVYHDCVLTSLRHSVDINNVVIIEDASILIRWTDRR